VAGRREVHDRVHPARDVAHEVDIADVAVHEGVAGIVLDVDQAGRIPGVGQLVEVDHAIVGVVGQDRADEVEPMKPAPPVTSSLI
jgi:hypothetical protein